MSELFKNPDKCPCCENCSRIATYGHCSEARKCARFKEWFAAAWKEATELIKVETKYVNKVRRNETLLR